MFSLLMVSAVGVLLSLGGIYSVMSFAVGAGSLLSGFLLSFWGFDTTGLDASPRELAGLLGYLMTGVCMLSCAVPTRRALSIEPSEALRAEG